MLATEVAFLPLFFDVCDENFFSRHRATVCLGNCKSAALEPIEIIARWNSRQKLCYLNVADTF